ncbi:YlmC/YmxH family sporulation protein [Clostridium fermenticellae]|uniref:YlmC/YmxH family sporulation protein n=1 Tax=Clostridium fermenticellae TaxID=2068654 RepID=A0A386H371_9CLOT|nr:YlmC/YmxH family sporulation protein [Clostridium fermenticellae]AYD39993.1 YlmC/YmxH family sporulation protein [Clostridium fermenticellae]
MEENESLYSIANLKAMEVIDINTGTKIGFIKDFKVDCESNKVVSIIIPSSKISWFGKNDDIEIPWENISKIGVDVILVNGEEFILNNK